MSRAFEDLADAVAKAEMALQDVRYRIDKARYALVAGNTAGEPVPPEVVGRWLDYIGGTREMWEVDPDEL